MLKDRIKSRRKELNMSQDDLAFKTGYKGKSAISRIENGQRDLSQSQIEVFAKALNTTPAYLMGWDNEEINKNPSEDSPKEGIDYMRVNVYGSVPAGIPIEAIEDITDTEDLSFKDYDRNKTYIGLKVRGDSMYPKYLDGDTIIIEVTPCAENGQDTVVYVNGYEATLKRFHKSENGIITLEPLNTNYSPKSYGENDEPIKVLGVVKEIRRKV